MLPLTGSRHLIDGSLSLDGFRSGWMAVIAALGQTRKSPGSFDWLITPARRGALALLRFRVIPGSAKSPRARTRARRGHPLDGSWSYKVVPNRELRAAQNSAPSAAARWRLQ